MPSGKQKEKAAHQMTTNNGTDRPVCLKQGLVHIYCGDGKGKTTACTGLAIRAASYRMRVLFCQFLKSGTSGELSVLGSLPTVEVLSGNPVNGFSWTMSPEEKQQTLDFNNDRLRSVLARMEAGEFDLVVLDEVIGAVSAGLVDGALLQRVVQEKPACCELVLSGRNPAPELLELADYVSEVVARKHPYETQGLMARQGIEF